MMGDVFLSPCEAGGRDRVAVRGASQGTAHGPRPLHPFGVPLTRGTGEEKRQ